MSRINPNAKQKVLNKYNGRCSYCGLKFDTLTLDHIKPVAEGGTWGIYNLRPACYDCNHCRGSRTIEVFRRLIEVMIGRKYSKGYHLNKTWERLTDIYKLPVIFYFETIDTGILDYPLKLPSLDNKYTSMKGLNWNLTL